MSDCLNFFLTPYSWHLTPILCNQRQGDTGSLCRLSHSQRGNLKLNLTILIIRKSQLDLSCKNRCSNLAESSSNIDNYVWCTKNHLCVFDSLCHFLSLKMTVWDDFDCWEGRNSQYSMCSVESGSSI